jgi:uncharacterized protein Veg
MSRGATMRTIPQNIDLTKLQVKNLIGTPIRLKVNRGRNKIEFIDGQIENAYPQIFTMRSLTGEINSFSYSDVLANNITFFASK